jgi:hypothetical protein
MRLHTDKLTYVDILRALTASWETSPDGGGFHADVVDPKGSRTRDHAFEIALVGFGSRHKRARAWGQGSYGKGDQSNAPRAATYDDWGYFIAQIFEADPNAVFGPYKGQQDFNRQTRFKFAIDDEPSPFTIVAAGVYVGKDDSLVLDAFAGGLSR